MIFFRGTEERRTSAAKYSAIQTRFRSEKNAAVLMRHNTAHKDRRFFNGLNGTILSCGLVAPVEREEILGFGWRLGFRMIAGGVGERRRG